jgi:TonB family protein
MLFALALGALISVAAFAAEAVLKGLGKPVRLVWATSLALSVLWPVAPTIARLLPVARPLSVLPFTIVVSTPYVISADEAAAIARALLVDRVLIGAWLVGSLLLVGRLVRGSVRLAATRRRWKRGRINGVRVEISDNVGPAVVGLRSMEVVVPEWILALDESLRALVLRHEEEHRSARDPYLLFGATVLVALMPWNVALWLQARRLRLGIEMDCDARVLRAHPSPERYGMLILTIAQRKSVAPALFAPMLSEPKTNLERRIRAMRTTKVARATVIAGGVVTVGVLALASSLQSAPETIPVAKTPPASRTSPSSQEVRKLESVRVSAPTTEAQYQNRAPRYPALLRAAEVEGAVIARLSYDAHGNVDPGTIDIVTSTNRALSESVREALRVWHGAPNSSLQVPFVFVLANKTGKDLADYPGGLPAGSVVVNAPPVSAAELAQRAAMEPTLVNPNQTFFEFQVERPATVAPGNRGPRYPDDLREAGVEGQVIAQFVVDADGQPDMSTFKVLESTRGGFTDAVASSLPDMQFDPARVGGRAVRQLVQMPFQFDLKKP